MRHEVFAALQNNGSAGRKPVYGPSDDDLLQRFAAVRDEAAFEALVQRHGPMVHGVCRRILGDAHEAEDAFQAVFLVLVRKSTSIRRPELLANWLYGVACRIARKARLKAVRKEIRERRAGKMPMQEQLLELEWAELKAVLDDELSQLPEKYRAPLVLCYLEGQTNAEAAARLGWPAGSISERLARARELLRKRLNRRGLTLSAGLLALLLSQKAASAAISPLLVEVTVKAGLTYSAPATAASSASSAVLDLASGSTNSAVVGYLKTFAVAFVIALVLAILWPQTRAFAEMSRWFQVAKAPHVVTQGDSGSSGAGGAHDSAGISSEIKAAAASGAGSGAGHCIPPSPCH